MNYIIKNTLSNLIKKTIYFLLLSLFLMNISNSLNFNFSNTYTLNVLTILNFLLITTIVFFYIVYKAVEKIKKINLDLQSTNLELDSIKIKLENSILMLKERNKVIKEKFFVDSITSLPNEKSLHDTIGIVSTDMIIIYINICHFREINSIFGYPIGDELLRQIGKRIIINNFTVYKSYGDEFIILIKDSANYTEVDTLANYLFSLISSEPYIVDNRELFLTANLGFAMYKKNEEPIKSLINLLHDSNFALKYAKENNLQYALYNQELVSKFEQNFSYKWKKNILTALQTDEIHVFYQPIVDNITRKVEKYEALMRIKDCDGSFISPYKFMIPSIKYGLYNDLTRKVVTRVINQIKDTNCEISINISINDIRNATTMRLIHKSIRSLTRTDAEKIIFELIESEGIENYQEINAFIKSIKMLGCKIAIDDFGSGYSNFNHLLNLEIDYIKIDSSIIKNIVNDGKSESIAKLIVEFSKTINAKTVAEFVDSEEIYNKVKELGIDYSQGYFFSVPKEQLLFN